MNEGHCLDCATLVWRTAPHPTTGDPILLWPDPTSQYVRVSCFGGTGEVRGLCYCQDCCPKAGSPAPEDVMMQVPTATVVLGAESGADRYMQRFTKAYGIWLATWASQYLRLDEDVRSSLLQQWEDDRQVVKRYQLTRGGDNGHAA